MTPSAYTYPLSIHSWKTTSGPIIIRCAQSGHLIGTFPLEFVLNSGVATWDFILSTVLRLIIVLQQHAPVIRNGHGDIMEASSPIHPGEYRLEHTGTRSPLSSSVL